MQNEFETFFSKRVFKLKRAQHSVHPTGGTLRVFRQFTWLGVGSGKMAFSPPAHQRVTPTVGQFIENQNKLLKLWRKTS
jgi:hypothetical protein